MQLANEPVNVSKTCQVIAIEDGGQAVPFFFPPSETAKLDSFGVKIRFHDVVLRLANMRRSKKETEDRSMGAVFGCIQISITKTGQTTGACKPAPHNNAG